MSYDKKRGREALERSSWAKYVGGALVVGVVGYFAYQKIKNEGLSSHENSTIESIDIAKDNQQMCFFVLCLFYFNC